MRRYAVKEIFRTIQGEGVNTGRPALFIRFAGCNLWSGREHDRERDAVRNDAACPRWCDTDFFRGTPQTAEQIAEHVRSAADGGYKLVVLTGGEPMLQLDTELLTAMRNAGPAITFAVETNGLTPPAPGVVPLLDHICVSPKGPPSALLIRHGMELKVVVPDYDPEEFIADGVAGNFRHLFVQPRDDGGLHTAEPGGRAIAVDTTGYNVALSFLATHPGWRLSAQTHKLLGLR